MNDNGYQMLKEWGGGGKKTKPKTKGGSTKNVASGDKWINEDINKSFLILLLYKFYFLCKYNLI